MRGCEIQHPRHIVLILTQLHTGKQPGRILVRQYLTENIHRVVEPVRGKAVLRPEHYGDPSLVRHP